MERAGLSKMFWIVEGTESRMKNNLMLSPNQIPSQAVKMLQRQINSLHWFYSLAIFPNVSREIELYWSQINDESTQRIKWNESNNDESITAWLIVSGMQSWLHTSIKHLVVFIAAAHRCSVFSCYLSCMHYSFLTSETELNAPSTHLHRVLQTIGRLNIVYKQMKNVYIMQQHAQSDHSSITFSLNELENWT